jgi:hypothetical protein
MWQQCRRRPYRFHLISTGGFSMLLKSLLALIPAVVLVLTAATVQGAPQRKAAPAPKPAPTKVLTTKGKGKQAAVIQWRVKDKITAAHVDTKVIKKIVD